MLTKIFIGEKVYIPLKEIRETGIGADFREIFISEDFGELVSEDIFNESLLNDEKLFSANGNYIELTKVSSLACRMNDLQKLHPLKYMFLHKSGEDDAEEISARLKKEDEEEIKKEIEKLCSEKSRLVETYRKEKEFLSENMEEIRKILEEAGLEIQFMTTVEEQKHVFIECYIAGENIFRNIYLPDWDMDFFREIKRNEDGTVLIPEPQEYEDSLFIPDNYERDFRKYTVSENLFWCIRNLPVSNDFSDEINFLKNGIYFNLKLPFLIKILNDNAFPEICMINGIPNFSEKMFVPENPYRKI